MKKGLLLLLVFISVQVMGQEFKNLMLGETAIDFELKTIQEETVQFSKMNNESFVVLLVLRGWVGYQCPVCNRQVGSFIAEAEKLEKFGVKILMVYPGPSEDLKKYASAFAEDFDLPANFYFALDPDYSMIDKYGLRWDAPKETAYPSTFVIDKSGKIVYSKISKTHGDRAKVEEVLEVLKR